MKKWALLHFVVPSLVVIALGLLLLVVLDRQAHDNQARINYATLDGEAQSVSTVLQSSIETQLSVVGSLGAFMSVNSDASSATFQAFAADLATPYRSINSLSFTDATTKPLFTYHAVPERGPSPARLLSGPDAEARVDQAIKSDSLAVYGPVYQTSGSLELFAFEPVTSNGKTVGLVVAVYDVPNLLAASLPISIADPSAKTTPQFEFRVLDHHGIEFYGAHSTSAEGASRPITVGDRTWTVQLYWRQPQATTPPGVLSLIWGLGGVCVLAALGWINREQLALMRQSRLARENARLLADSNHLLQQTQALQAIMTDVTARRTVEDVLNAVADQVAQVFGAGHVGLFVLERGELSLQWNITRNLDPQLNARVAELYIGAAQRGALDQRGPNSVADVAAESRLGAVGDILLQQGIHALLVVPLRRENSVGGALVLYHDQPQQYSAQTCALAQGFADQAAIAVENARLLLEAHGKASLEERQRLARDLHDSVSQALFGITLGARTGRTLLESDPKGAADAMDYVVTLAKAGLSEMRALIFELRPESLQNEGLLAALNKQAESLRARYNVAVDTRLIDEPDVPLAVKEALYRVVQEALHNVVKHAHAKKVDLGLQTIDHQVVLTIHDDGSGFDALGSFPGHLGLHSMRERIAQCGGVLEIESVPNAGTLIRARIPLAPATLLAPPLVEKIAV